MQLTRNEEILYAAQHVNMEICEVSHALLDPEWNMPNLCASFTRLYFPLEGEALLTIDGREVRLEPGNIYVIPSGLNFSGFCPVYMKKIYVHLTLTRPDGTDLLGDLGRCLILRGQTERIDRVASLYASRDLCSVLKLKLVLHEILDEALTLCPPPHTELKHYSDLTKAALSYIDRHLSADLTIDKLASALFVSKLVLQRKFKEDLGKPIGAYVDSCLLSRAERLLLDTNQSVKEISDSLGYCDQFYFSRKFSQSHGVSPRTFRQLHIT